MTVPDGFPMDDAVTAHALMRPWWRALATDDDAAVRRLNHPACVEDQGPGLASRVRDGLGVSVEQCAAMGIYNTLSILGDGAWAFHCKTGIRATYERRLTTRQITPERVDEGHGRGWLIRVGRTAEGSWRVWGWSPDAVTVDRVILPPLAGLGSADIPVRTPLASHADRSIGAGARDERRSA